MMIYRDDFWSGNPFVARRFRSGNLRFPASAVVVVVLESSSKSGKTELDTYEDRYFQTT